MKKGTIITILGGVVGAGIAIASSIIGRKKDHAMIEHNDEDNVIDCEGWAEIKSEE